MIKKIGIQVLSEKYWISSILLFTLWFTVVRGCWKRERLLLKIVLRDAAKVKLPQDEVAQPTTRNSMLTVENTNGFLVWLIYLANIPSTYDKPRVQKKKRMTLIVFRLLGHQQPPPNQIQRSLSYHRALNRCRHSMTSMTLASGPLDFCDWSNLLSYWCQCSMSSHSDSLHSSPTFCAFD
jgi:hypothetical protein